MEYNSKVWRDFKFQKHRNFLCLQEYSPEEIEAIIKVSEQMKLWEMLGEEHHVLRGRTMAMLFQKPSTRTRVSLEVAMYQLGGYALYLNAQELQLRRGETIADTARVLSGYVDAIAARVYSHRDVEELAEYSSVPVINALSDFSHPTHAPAVFMTIKEKLGRVKGIRYVYVGDGNNMCHSLIVVGTKLGAEVVVATPEGYEPDSKVIEWAEKNAAESGGNFELLHDPVKAVKNADVIYTDTWVSMGDEAEAEERRKVFAPFQVNRKLVMHATPNYLFMHCLPAHRGEEVTDEIIDSEHSAVWDEARNKLPVQKAILSLVIP